MTMLMTTPVAVPAGAPVSVTGEVPDTVSGVDGVLGRPRAGGFGGGACHAVKSRRMNTCSCKCGSR